MSLLSKSATARLAPCSSRVKPFAPAYNGSLKRAQAVVPRAAEEEAVAEAEAEAAAQLAVDEFAFNYSDAKKGNQWQPSDVEAAMAYYQDEKFLQGSSDMPYEAEFVTNPLSAYVGGPEDSSWLADVDNTEAYENDDYALAGIPEAAPKVKRQQREEVEESSEEELRAVEDEKISAAAFDDVEGLEEEGDDNPEAAWNWNLGGSTVYDEVEVSTAGRAAASEEELINSLAVTATTAQDAELSLEQRDLLSVVLDQVPAEDGLDLIGEELEAADAAVEGLTQDEEAAIAALLKEQVDISGIIAASSALPDLSDDVADAEAEAQKRGEPLSQSAVQEYISALAAVDASAGIDDATVEQLLAEGAEVVAETSIELGEAPALPEISSDLSAEDDAFQKFLESEEAQLSTGEAESAGVVSMLGELETLAGEVDEYNEMVFPADADLQEYNTLIDAALEYYEAAGTEDATELRMRSDDAPVNMYEDINPELLGAVGGMDEGDDAYEREGQFVERILELGRVTKVVKGGKIMGFRCVAVVGDGKGKVGVGCQAGREVGTAVKRALVDAKKSIIEVPLVGAGTIPHRTEAWFKAAGVVIQPAADGTGVIAGGAVRSVLELAGVQNVLAKRLGSRSTLNNARVTLKALSELRTMDDYAAARGIPLDYMLS